MITIIRNQGIVNMKNVLIFILLLCSPVLYAEGPKNPNLVLGQQEMENLAEKSEPLFRSLMQSAKSLLLTLTPDEVNPEEGILVVDAWVTTCGTLDESFIMACSYYAKEGPSLYEFTITEAQDGTATARYDLTQDDLNQEGSLYKMLYYAVKDSYFAHQRDGESPSRLTLVISLSKYCTLEQECLIHFLLEAAGIQPVQCWVTEVGIPPFSRITVSYVPPSSFYDEEYEEFDDVS